MRKPVLICLVALAAFTVSCVQEHIPDYDEMPEGALIAATIDPADTKTSYDSGSGKFAWSIGDHIALYNDGAYTKARLAKIKGDTGYFSLPLSSTSRSHYALYPFDLMDEGHFGDAPEGLWVNLPDSYFVENSEAGWRDSLAVYSPMPMVAVNTEGQKLHFKHLGAMIRVTLRNIPSGTRIIAFQTGENITGKFRVFDPSSDAPYIRLDDDIASGRGNLVRVHFRQTISGEVTLSLPLPPGNYSLFRVTTHSGYDKEASGWGMYDKNRTLLRGDARKITIDLDGSTPHIYSFTPAEEEITIIKGLTAILPYTAMKTAADTVKTGDGLALSCYSSAPAVADALISADDPPVLRIDAKEVGTSIFTVKAIMAGKISYSFVKVNVVELTGLRVDIAGLPNMLNGRDRQTLTPTVWTEPPSSKELDYEWNFFDWESDNTASATVDSDGVVTAGSTDGTASISCKVKPFGTEYTGTYRVNVVTNPAGTLPGVFTYDEYGHYFFFAKSNLVYWKDDDGLGYYESYERTDPIGSMKNGLLALGENQYDYYTGRVFSGDIGYKLVNDYATPGYDKFHFLVPQTLFSSSASTQRLYTLNYAAYPNPKDWYNMSTYNVEYPILEDLGTGWYAPSIGQWNYVLFSRRASTVDDNRHCRFARVIITGVPALYSGKNYVRGILILPDIYEHPAGLPALQRINERNGITYSVNTSTRTDEYYNTFYTNYTKEQLAQLEAAGCVFLSSCGWYRGEYEYDSESTTSAHQQRNWGGWYYDNMLYCNNRNMSFRFYTYYEHGETDFYYSSNAVTDVSSANWDWRFAIRLVHDDGTFIHDYNLHDPENW